MIIDLILDRRDNDALIANGYTHSMDAFTGELKPLAYDQHQFYHDVMRYGTIGHGISAAMDYGTEIDVKKALCEYVITNNYNPDICGYIKAVQWLN